MCELYDDLGMSSAYLINICALQGCASKDCSLTATKILNSTETGQVNYSATSDRAVTCPEGALTSNSGDIAVMVRIFTKCLCLLYRVAATRVGWSRAQCVDSASSIGDWLLTQNPPGRHRRVPDTVILLIPRVDSNSDPDWI